MYLKKYSWLILIVFLFTLVNVSFLLKPHSVGWDESVYISIGKFFYSLGRFGLFEIIRPPLLPIIFGLGWRVGINPIFFAMLCELAFSIGCITFTYLIAQELFDKKTAIFSSLLLAFTPLFVEYTNQLLTTIPSCFFVLCGIYCLIKKKYFLSGIFGGLAFLTRFVMGLYFLFILIYFLFFEKKLIGFIKNAFGSFLIVLPYLLINTFVYTTNKFSFLYPLYIAMMHQSNPMHKIHGIWNNLLFYLKDLIMQNWFLVAFIIGLFKIKQKKHATFVYPLLVFAYYTYIVNKQLRFALAILPFLCILSASGILIIYNQIKNIKLIKPIFMILIIVFSLGITNRIYTLYDQKPNELIQENDLINTISNLDGTILTTMPMPIASLDKKFIITYQQFDLLVNDYLIYRNQSNYFIYTPDLVACFEDECFKQKGLFWELINKENKLLFEKDLYGTSVYIYEL